MQTAQSYVLPDGRLHLNHGPIDLLIEAWGQDRARAFHRATARFQTILTELVGELPLLRVPPGTWPEGTVAKRMTGAVASHANVFVTPMAAVAGSVADEICYAMIKGLKIERAYVNNGGDIAVYLGQGQSLSAAIIDGADAGRVHLTSKHPARGLATSGWRGRSHSLGIADAVTVIARNAAAADVAATLIANAVDLPAHPAIKRQPAHELAPDSDLGGRLVTTTVGPLARVEVAQALDTGRAVAEGMHENNQIIAAALFLNGRNTTVGSFPAAIPNVKGGQDARIHAA